ncbi:MAG TPA: hypothetical protein VKT53_08265 [Candidatus Acidoferrum sp.]|nr:hypothetical protein [Candidatus Acidoferrum sp.]
MPTPDYRAIFASLAEQHGELLQTRAELEVKLGDVTKEIESLNEAMNHLAPLAGYALFSESVANLGITDAVRGVLDPEVRMSAAEVKAKMVERGFDFSKYSAPDASVRTILKRLVDGKKAEVEKEGWKSFYRFLATDQEIPF